MERDEAVRRNTRLLATAQGSIQVAFPVFLVVAGPVAADLSGTATTLGVITAAYFVSAAGGPPWWARGWTVSAADPASSSRRR